MGILNEVVIFYIPKICPYSLISIRTIYPSIPILSPPAHTAIQELPRDEDDRARDEAEDRRRKKTKKKFEVSDLKSLVMRPDVVTEADTTSPDPEILVWRIFCIGIL